MRWDSEQERAIRLFFLSSKEKHKHIQNLNKTLTKPPCLLSFLPIAMKKSSPSQHPRIAARTSEEQISRDELAQVILSVKQDLNSCYVTKQDEAAQVIQQNILKTLGFTKAAILECLKVPFMWSYRFFDTAMSRFEWLDNEVAMKLIANGYWWLVAKHLTLFSWVDHKEIALALLAKKKWDDLLSHISKFDRISLDREIAMKLLENKTRYSFADRIQYFTLEPWDYKDIAYTLVCRGEGNSIDRNLYKFTWLTPEDIIYLNDNISNASEMIYTVDDEKFVLSEDTKGISFNISWWRDATSLSMDYKNNVSYFRVTSNNCENPCEHCKKSMFTAWRRTWYHFYRSQYYSYSNYALYQKLPGVPKDTSIESLKEFLQLPVVADKQ